MSTCKFVSVVVSALVAFILVVSFVNIALADNSVRSVEAVVVSYNPSSFEVEVIDTEGEMWAYYADEAIVGEHVVITVLNNVEIIDVVRFLDVNAIQEVETC